MSLIDRFFSKKTPTRDEFAVLVMKALSPPRGEGVVYDSAGFVLKAKGRDSTIFLDNGYAKYCKADKVERNAIIARLCSVGIETTEIPAQFESVKSFLMPVIRDRCYSSLIEIHVRSRSMDVSNMECPTVPLFGPLHVGLAYDSEHAIQQITKRSFNRWQVSFEAALKEARDNLREKTDPGGMVEVSAGIYKSRWNDSYDSARIILTDLIYRIPVSGNPIVFVPNRNQLWVTGSYDKSVIIELLQTAGESHFEPYPISPDLFQLSDGVWNLYVPEDPATRDLLLSLKRRRQAVDYQQQKEGLDAIYQATGIDVFVASFKVFELADGSRYSMCVWSNGIDSLLPKAERILFLVDADKKDHFSLLWESALSVVNDLMEEDQNLLPELYRVRRFPDPAQIERLRKLV